MIYEGLTETESRIIDLNGDWKFRWYEHSEDLGKHASSYFNRWLRSHDDRFFECESIEEAKELEKSMDVLADAELDVVRELSDVAIELRFDRLRREGRGFIS